MNPRQTATDRHDGHWLALIPQKVRITPKGQSLIEFALTLVIILMLLAGIVDLGRAIFTYLALRDGAQEGASFALYNPTISNATLNNRICSSSNLLQTECAAGNVSATMTIGGAACTGGSILVQVTYPNFTLVTPFLGTILGRQTIPITARVTDTILAPPCP
jgi:Flp pilus assembly protein TadG